MAIIYLYRTNDKNAASASARKIVKQVATKKLKVNISEEDFDVSPNGKPYLKNYPDFHFNISHSQDLVAVAFAASPVGVDIELLRKPDLRVAKRFFTPEEQENSSDEGFFEIWTQKEAYIKMKGLTLSSLKHTDNQNTVTYRNKLCVVSACIALPEAVEISSLEKIINI